MNYRATKIITIVCQWLVGLTFLVSGLVKAIDPVGTSLKIGEYLQHFGMSELAGFSIVLACLQALFEFSLGLYVFIGYRRIVCATLLIAFMGVMTPLSLYLALSNPVDDCGCFGDALVLTNWQTFWKNIILLLLVVWLRVKRRFQQPMLSRTFHTFYYYVQLVGVIFLLWQGIMALPYIDFRPYRPGVSLDAQKSVNSEPDEYVIVYEKEGVRKEFALESLPDEDSGWEFVETITRHSPSTKPLLGSHAEISNLVIFDPDGNDVTQEIVGYEGYVMLLLSPDLAKADQHDIDRIENLYEYALERDYPFYCLTWNNEASIEHWKFSTGSEYPLLFADQQVIETMIRSNPGFMLLHNGVILWKSHLSGVDVPLLTSAKLSEQTMGQIRPIDRKKRVFWMFVWLIAPLMLYLPMEIIKFTHKNNKKNEKENCCR